MVLVLKWPFFQLFFLGNVGQNNVFYDILEQKTSFQAIKTRNSNSPKITIFLTFFFFAVQARKMCFTIFYNKKTPFWAIKTRSLKRQKIDIFPKGLTHGFGPKIAIFLSFFFQAIQGRKMFFMILWNEKKPFQTIKTRSSKSRKIHIFPKGLTHGLVPRISIFPTVFFFLGKTGQENVFCDILERKTPFQAIKTRSSKSRKSDIFPKGLTHGFGPKIAIFPTFFFQAIRPGKCLLLYSRTKIRFSRL